MKRILFAIFTLLAFPDLSAQQVLVGDMNGDNELNVQDVTELVNTVINKAEKKYIYSAEEFIKENALTGTFKINGVEKKYDKGVLDPYNGHEYVDLGLSVKWAKVNIGASTASGMGSRFAWGETVSKNEYYWDSYEFCDGKYDVMNKYCTDSDYGTIDYTLHLLDNHDAASVNWGGNWRMPRKEEFEELLANCYMVHTTNYMGTYVDGYIIYKVKSNLDKGAVGYKVSSEVYETSDTHIFIPAVGYKSSQTFGSGVRGYYWTNTLYAPIPNQACSLYFYPGGINLTYFSRCYGLPIRAVCP